MDGRGSKAWEGKECGVGSPLGPAVSALRASVQVCLLSKLTEVLKDAAPPAPSTEAQYIPPRPQFCGQETLNL